MRLSRTIETFLVFLPRRQANHRGIGRFVRCCLQLVTHMPSLDTYRVHVCANARVKKRDRENWENGRRNRNTDNYRSYDPKFVSNIKMQKPMFSGDIFRIPGRIYREECSIFHKIRILYCLMRFKKISYFSHSSNNLIHIKINFIIFLKAKCRGNNITIYEFIY